MASETTNRIAEKIMRILDKNPAVKITDFGDMENFFHFFLKVRVGDEERRLLVKVLSQQEIEHFSEIITKMIFRQRTEITKTYYIIGAFYIGDKELKRIDDTNFGYIDLQGNYRFYLGSASMEKRVGRKKTPEEIFRSVFSLKSSRIVRVLLEARREGGPIFWTLRDLCKEAKVSLGLVQQVVNKLLDLGYLERRYRKQGVRLIEPGDLLDKWAKYYDFYQNKVFGFYCNEDPTGIGIEFLNYCNSREEERYATTLAAAADVYMSPPAITEPPQFCTYFSGDVGDLKEALRFKDVTKEANVIIAIPKDEFTYYRSWVCDEWEKVVSPIQLYLDLYSFWKERGDEWEYGEAMRYLRDTHINF